MKYGKLRIAHICLASSYTQGMTYQDNLLPAQNRRDGHEVLIVSDCNSYIRGKLAAVPPEDIILGDGTRLVRLKFAGRALPRYLRNKLRLAPQLRCLLEEFKPDVILFHGVIGAELLTVGNYKRANPGVRLYLDCHEDFNNSGRNFASRIFQYRLLTRFFWKRIAEQVDKVLYVSYECRDFLREMYAIPEHSMEFYPLGGYVKEPSERIKIRNQIRCSLDLGDDDIVFIHAGKLDKAKRTIEVLEAFSSTSEPNLRLLIVGVFDKEIEKEALAYIANDNRFLFLGWKSGDELNDLLCASDVYLQPGTQSATLQVAICCGLPVMVYPYSSHAPYLAGNGFYVREPADILTYLPEFQDAHARRTMSEASLAIGRRLLDYRTLAKRLYQ